MKQAKRKQERKQIQTWLFYWVWLGWQPMFRFVTKTVLATQGCFHYCSAELTQSQGPFCSSPHPTNEKARGEQGAGKRHSQDSRPWLIQEISLKLGEIRRKMGTFMVMTFVFPSIHRMWWSPAFSKWLDICHSMGSNECFACFALLEHSSVSLIKLSDSLSFQLLYFRSSPLCPPGGEGSEWVTGLLAKVSSPQ